MNSLVLLQPRNFTVLERQFHLEYYTQKAKSFTDYYVSHVCSQFVSSVMPSPYKVVC